MELDAFKWAELPERAAHMSFNCIGPNSVRTVPEPAPTTFLQRVVLRLLRLPKPSLYHIYFDLDVSRFPDGIQINDMYRFRKTGQLFVVTNFSVKGCRIKMRSATPNIKPNTLCVGDWDFYAAAPELPKDESPNLSKSLLEAKNRPPEKRF